MQARNGIISIMIGCIHVIFIFMSLFFNLLMYAFSEQVDPLKGQVYTEQVQNVVESSIFKEYSGISKLSCALRCKRSKECIKAAVQQKDSEEICLHLKKPTTTDGEEATTVTVLKEFVPRKLLEILLQVTVFLWY